MGAAASDAIERRPLNVSGRKSEMASNAAPNSAPRPATTYPVNTPSWAFLLIPERRCAGGAITAFPSCSVVGSGGHQHAAVDRILHRPARAQRDAGQGILGDADRKAGLFLEMVVEALDQRPATGQHDALFDNVGGKLRRGVLKR